MLDEFIAILKEKKLYHVTRAICAFFIVLIVNQVFSIGIVLFPFLLFIGSRALLKRRLKGQASLLVNAIAIQFTHYFPVLLAAFAKPLPHLFDFFVIFWGTGLFIKNPGWKSGRLMIAYNAYRFFLFYIPGFVNAINTKNSLELRSALFMMTLSVLAAYMIYDGVKKTLNQPVPGEEQIAAEEEEPEDPASEQEELDR